jgi:hypothetical protein
MLQLLAISCRVVNGEFDDLQSMADECGGDGEVLNAEPQLNGDFDDLQSMADECGP